MKERSKPATDEIRRLIEVKGLLPRQVSGKLKISRQRVYRVMADEGIVPPKPVRVDVVAGILERCRKVADRFDEIAGQIEEADAAGDRVPLPTDIAQRCRAAAGELRAEADAVELAMRGRKPRAAR